MDVRSIFRNTEELYGEQPRQMKYATSRNLFQIKMTVESSVGDHVLKMITYVNELELLNAGPDAYRYTDIILQSLTPAYSRFISQFLMMDLKPTLPALLNLLRQEESSMKKGQTPALVIGKSSSTSSKLVAKKKRMKKTTKPKKCVKKAVKKDKGKGMRSYRKLDAEEMTLQDGNGAIVVAVTELNYVRQRYNTGSYKNSGPSKSQLQGPKSQQFKRKKVSRGACYNYGKFGHFKSNYPQGEKQENKGGYKHSEQGGTSKREFFGMTKCNAMMTDISGWWIDSDMTRHIAKDKNGVVEFTKLKKGEHIIYMGNNTYLDVEGIGSYRLDLGDNILVLKYVFYVPGIWCNLISVPSLIKK
ncbi:uncharacterized protein LOC109846267 [Asparagus officinalis]|uniref:uncharacterized protein LOC109846267 n=1 Tax=Asparagus officinalis TaxID=4686 RepID=UPI00098E4DE0|nr:uncharacterized protein LOC109846267 [Asparagus officinalis]